ncbi:MAG: NADP-dependent malic enzyme [Chloroflexota bacterium]|nr:NADP-dependent malic enzyme [Chloroflexota bacterium]
MMQKVTKEELLTKAKKPAQDAMKLHVFYRGKMQTMLKCQVRDLNDFAIYYTPGVAEPCGAIQMDEKKMGEFTNRWNMIAIVSDGTRVLGLGDIGPKAGYPVMEGKALLFKYLGGVDAVAICLGTKNPDEIVQAVKWLEPSFAGINLEDISYPKCFGILNQLRKEMTVPVWHDDVQGTATVILAALINALKIVGKKIEDCKIVFNGVGAANTGCSRLIWAYGGDPENSIMVDSKGILHRGRKDLEEVKDEYSDKWRFCEITNSIGITGTLAEALQGADVLISCSRSGPGIISPEQIKGMAKDAICFTLANPIPEIWPWEAREAGARIVGTGRSDFPNQVNNSVGFPAIFRGVLDVQARTITNEMCIAAAEALAKYAQERGINDDDIVARMDEREAYVREAVAVGMKAQEQGIALLKVGADELRCKAENMIASAQAQSTALVEAGLIAPISSLGL